jgi:hypothetical protein
MRSLIAILLGILLLTCLWAAPSAPAEEKKPSKLPLSGSAPAKLVPNLCLLRYRISTDSTECQAFFDQGLAYYYSYLSGAAAQSFETATLHDPDCPMAWWGLTRALAHQNKTELALQALEKARAKLAQASHREQFLIKALLQMPPRKPLPQSATAEAREQAQKQVESQRQAATRTIDEMLSLYDEDEEGWYFRAKLAAGGISAGPSVSSVPFYKVLVRINPLHPGATHELIHYYDSAGRWGLAWPHTENYIKGSPGIGHAYHMQIDHVAIHQSRWDRIIDHAPKAGEHNMHMVALAHEGRFAEARKVGDAKSFDRFYILLAQQSWDDARALLDVRRDDKCMTDYMTAIFHLKQDRPDLAAPAVEALRQALKAPPEKNAKTNRSLLQNWLLEAEGGLLCLQGDAKAGLDCLAKLNKRTEYSHREMGWAFGAYYDEIYGTAALRGGQDEVAEEALMHALAHDSGSVRGALGLGHLCERQCRDDEARRFRELAGRIWQKADAGALDAELAYLRKSYPAKPGSEAAPVDE